MTIKLPTSFLVMCLGYTTPRHNAGITWIAPCDFHRGLSSLVPKQLSNCKRCTPKLDPNLFVFSLASLKLGLEDN